MAHAFDSHTLGQLLMDAERVAATASDQEHRLASLVGLMEHRGTAKAAGAGGASTAQPGRPLDLLAMMRELCVAAREQRQRAEAIVARMIGDGVRVNGNSPHRDRVLIVDDNMDNLDVAAATLEASGFDVITAVNGLEAVIVAHYADPAVVLMDVSMPVLDGLDATRLLKASSVTRNLKVIAYTARPELFNSSLDALFAGILTKPVDPTEMIATVRKLIAR